VRQPDRAGRTRLQRHFRSRNLLRARRLFLREADMHREGARAVAALRGFLDRPAVVSLIVSCALLILFLGFALGEVFGQIHQAGRRFKTPKQKRNRHSGSFTAPSVRS
jgi:hypothetical protein